MSTLARVCIATVEDKCYNQILDSEAHGYYSAIRSLFLHMVCNVPVSCKANEDRNHLGAWLDSGPIA